MTMHNETAGDFRNYESQIDEAFGLYDDLGIRSIKNGYVADDGDLAGEGYNHHNQVLVNHHTLVAETAAANRQMLDIHEPIHPTGRRRTYPNLMTREGVKGQEYDAFGDVSPRHHVTFPFTRMLGGPVEYTPGIFDTESGSGGIETTRAKQLAMYPTYFSGLQMVADLPSSYLADRPATLEVGEVAQAQHADLDGFVTRSEWANAQGEEYVPSTPAAPTAVRRHVDARGRRRRRVRRSPPGSELRGRQRARGGRRRDGHPPGRRRAGRAGVDSRDRLLGRLDRDGDDRLARGRERRPLPRADRRGRRRFQPRFDRRHGTRRVDAGARRAADHRADSPRVSVHRGRAGSGLGRYSSPRRRDRGLHGHRPAEG